MRVEHVMGTAFAFDVRAPADDADGTVQAAFDWLRWVDATFSTYQPGSEISRLGRGDLDLAGAHPAVRDVLEQCEALRRSTRGYFDARAAPDGCLDPSGLVKGWSVEIASARLAAAGLTNHSINAGGDVRLRGCSGPGRSWKVGVAHPLEPGALTVVLRVSDGAVATSGSAERGHHVFDPHTGRPATGLASATIVGPSLTLADAYATAAFAMGVDAPDWAATLDGYEAYLVDAGGHAWWSRGFPRYREAWPP